MPRVPSNFPNSLGVPGFATSPNARDSVWIPVLSSNIHRIRYEPEDKRYKVPKPAELWIHFWKKLRGGAKIPGRIYRYFGVPRGVWDGLLAASSKGEFHWAHIRGHYSFS